MRKSPVIDVIIPALNEENAVGLVIGDLPDNLIREVIVVDNGSSDQTPKVARESGAIVLFEERKGYGSACLKALSHIHSKEDHPDIIVFIDADYSDYPEQLHDLVQPITEEDMDLVIGSRVLGKVEKGALTIPQRVGNALACRLINLFFGYTFTDLGPFRAVKYEALQQMKMKDPDYGWTVEMQIKAALLKLKCMEVPVRYKKRIGVSKVSGTIKGVLMAGYKIIGLILLYSITSWK